MVDNTVLYCCHCGKKTIVALHKHFNPRDFLNEDSIDGSIQINSNYYEFSEILNMIEDLRQKLEESQKETQILKDVIESNKKMNDIHKWQLSRMTYVEEIIDELRKMDQP